MLNQLISITSFEGIIHLKQKHNETLSHSIGALKCLAEKFLRKSEEGLCYSFMAVVLSSRQVEAFPSTW